MKCISTNKAPLRERVKTPEFQDKMLRKFYTALPYMVLAMVVLSNPAFPLADDSLAQAYQDIQKVLDSFLKVIGLVFSGTGILLTAYSVGKAVLAFKNDDTDGQQRAASGIIVGIVLIFLYPVINGMGLTKKLFDPSKK